MILGETRMMWMKTDTEKETEEEIIVDSSRGPGMMRKIGGIRMSVADGMRVKDHARKRKRGEGIDRGMVAKEIGIENATGSGRETVIKSVREIKSVNETGTKTETIHAREIEKETVSAKKIALRVEIVTEIAIKIEKEIETAAEIEIAIEAEQTETRTSASIARGTNHRDP